MPFLLLLLLQHACMARGSGEEVRHLLALHLAPATLRQTKFKSLCICGFFIFYFCVGVCVCVCARLDGQKCNMRCEEAARESAGTDLHNGAQIPHRFLFNTSSKNERRKRDRRRGRQPDRNTDRNNNSRLLRSCLEKLVWKYLFFGGARTFSSLEGGILLIPSRTQPSKLHTPTWEGFRCYLW